MFRPPPSSPRPDTLLPAPTLVRPVAVTGALHLDGLGDIADGSGAAHKDRERLLAVLGDPHAGSFAVVAIALQLIAKLVLLHALIERDAEGSPVGVGDVLLGADRKSTSLNSSH